MKKGQPAACKSTTRQLILARFTPRPPTSAPWRNVNTRQQPGDSLKAGYPIIRTLEADDTPLRLYLGSDALAAVRGALCALLEEREKWAELSKTTDFDA